MTADSDYYTNKLYKFRRVPKKIRDPVSVFVPPGKFLSEALPLRQRTEIRGIIASESLQKIRSKFYEVAGHVGRVRGESTPERRSGKRIIAGTAFRLDSRLRVSSTLRFRLH